MTQSIFSNLLMIFSNCFLSDSVLLPYRLERDAIINNYNLKKYLPYLILEAKRLEKAGADFIVMPCNSLHLFIADIRKSVNIPILSIVENTAEFLQKKYIKKAGIVSTAITAKHKLYINTLAKPQKFVNTHR